MLLENAKVTAVHRFWVRAPFRVSYATSYEILESLRKH